MDLYTKIDAGIDVGNADDNNVEEETDDEVAFLNLDFLSKTWTLRRPFFYSI